MIMVCEGLTAELRGKTLLPQRENPLSYKGKHPAHPVLRSLEVCDIHTLLVTLWPQTTPCAMLTNRLT